MPSKQFTLETRLEKSELTAYLNNFVSDYNKIYRYAWHRFTSHTFKEVFETDSKFVTHLCGKFGILERTSNSIVRDIKGRVNALRELKKYEKSQLKVRISKKIEHIAKLKAVINTLKPKVRAGFATEKELKRYRSAKQSLYFQQNRLNKMKQSLCNLEYQIKNRIYKLCFGSSKMLRKQHLLAENNYKSHIKWYNDYIKMRDSNIYSIGCSEETQGNQMFQMVYNPKTDDFSFKIRKDCGYDTDSKYIYYNNLDFGYLFLKNRLKEICISHQNGLKAQPLSYRFHRKDNKWYLQVMFAIKFEEYETTNKYGTIGLDYNNGFIEMSETDEKGNLIAQKHYKLAYHGTGNKAKSEIREIVSNIVNVALSKGKDISIEKLDFKNTKAKTIKGKSKGYNRMLHAFDYSRYIETICNACHRKRINLIQVEAYNTSKIGKEKYSKQKKLNIHQAASYVIARKGQGFIDKITA